LASAGFPSTSRRLQFISAHFIPLPGFQTFQWVRADQNQVFFPPRRDASMSQTKRAFFLSPATPPASILLLEKHSAHF
jgi:hypothetical protein